jgi:pimeloyl-ACP methyl ester carboxylesterase
MFRIRWYSVFGRRGRFAPVIEESAPLDENTEAEVAQIPLPENPAAAPYVPPPSPLLALTELHRVAIEVVSLQLSSSLLERAPKGDGHPVMVLPGFMGSDTYNASLRRFLASLGYAVHGWGLGQNLGPRDGALEKLAERLEDLADRYGSKLSLVGHSLGGIFARELAREFPDRVRQVISLGSPFGVGRRTGSYPARLFARLNPRETLTVEENRLHLAPPVPTTAVYSRGDGIVNWRTSRQSPVHGHVHSENIEVYGSHCGMTLNPTIWYLVADRLAQPELSWRPFRLRSWSRLLYPLAG